MALSDQISLLASRIATELKARTAGLTGGTAGQVLTKTDATNYNYAWATPAAGGAAGVEFDLNQDWTTTTPATPTTGLTLFSRFRARRMLAIVGPTGQDTSLQPAIFSNKIARWNANNALAPSTDGISVTNIAAPTTLSNATTNFFSSLVKARFTSAATAGAAAGLRSSTPQWFLSATPNMGGFFFVARAGLATTTATNRLFIGMSSTTGALSATVDPSTLFNLVGFGSDSANANLQFMCNDGAGVATKVDLGVNFRAQVAATDFYEFRLFAPSGNASIVYWSIQRLNDGAFVQGSANTNLPVANTLLSAHINYSNGTTASAVSLDLQSLYIDSDN